MAAHILRRASARPSTFFAQPTTQRILTPALPAAVSHRIRHATTTQGTPNASNVSNPQSGSTEQSDVKTSRATDSAPNPDSASVQSPISGGNLEGGKSEDPDDHEVKRDPGKPAGQKKEEVLKQGQKPLGAEDKQ